MIRFKNLRCSEMVTVKILPSQRDFLEKRAIARDASLCSVIREIIDREMNRVVQ